MENMSEETHGEMTDPQHVHLSFPSESSVEEMAQDRPDQDETEKTEIDNSIIQRLQDRPDQDETEKKEIDNRIIQRLQSGWIGTLHVVFLVLLLVLITVIVGLSINVKQLQKERSQLRQLLESTHMGLNHTMEVNQKVSQSLNFTVEENQKLRLSLNYTMEENLNLSLSLNNTMEENQKLSRRLNYTMEDNQKLSLSLNYTMEDNLKLSRRLNHTKEENQKLSLSLSYSMEENQRLSRRLNHTMEVNQKVSQSLNFTVEENQKLRLSLNYTMEENLNLSLSLNNTMEENQKLSRRLNYTMEENLNLSQRLNHTKEENQKLRLSLNYTMEENLNLSLSLNSTKEENQKLSLSLSYSMEENQRLSRRLNHTMAEKSQLQVQIEEMKIILNSTMENRDSFRKDKIKYQQLLINERQTSTQLKAENQRQQSILMSEKLSFLWRFCDKGTLQCSRCLPGWAEHATRCFHLASQPMKWEDARRECFNEGADLAVVLNAADQAFLTNMTFQFTQQHPNVLFHSAWIGLQDMVQDNRFVWVNGIKSKSDLKFWMPGEPNNAAAQWDKDRAGQDCVVIVPPKTVGQKGWLNSWDDVVCRGQRHYICETKALILSGVKTEE
ncbi:CD209 antigen-like protein E [Xyrichtys novacula]|uniref:CD209 antigen-like protein E n=1 Tax=Xyrichtys novacula TaxID=13765 RepID=A0AAV1EIS9_XYRNO|nr:CD209 antigen-like protein E [Xyrichtys novacula]CAJ1048631.1 CD209 antigen-like protein E [Xyrichtys novacula]CAJ1048645.1 CD209 antigen-like protein E [Xyrichtys novacula]